MFKIEPGTFTRTVDIKVPNKEGFETQTVDVTYKVMPVSRSQEMETGQDVIDFIHEAVINIDGLMDEKSEPLKWDAEVEAKFWDLPYVFSHIRDAYSAALEEARVKN